MVATVRALPAPEKTEKVLELIGFGWSPKDIADKVFGPDVIKGGLGIKAVRQIIADPDRFHTDVDEVAVARALQGDRAVYEAMTHYERRALMLIVHARREREYAENAEDAREFAWLRGLFNYKAPHDPTPEWVEQLAEALGYDRAADLVRDAKVAALARVL